jgi:tetratricopeptide (TPR) repeat protein
MQQTEGVYDWSPETEIRTGPQPREAPGDALETGTDQELNGRLLAAYETYTRALDASPSSQALRLAAGRLAASLQRYQDALHWLVPAQAHATYDPEIAYYLGIAYEGLGQARQARTQFETAHRMPEFRAAGSVKLAELSAREGDRAQAVRYLHEALRSAPDDRRAIEELSLLEPPGAGLPLNSLRPEAIASDPERLLAVAGAYMRLGLWREALGALSRQYPDVPPEQKEPGAPLPQNHPMVAYYRAYCRERLGEPAAAEYQAASKLSTAYVFPNGAQALAVLEAAVRARPGDATAHYLLGNLRLASGLVDQAIGEWQTARRIDPAIPVLDASLGRILLRIRHDPQAALEAFRAGRAADPQNIQVYAGIDETMSILGAPATERVAALEGYPGAATMPASLVYDLALSYAEAGRFDKAKALFENRFFPREEGGTNVRQVWVRVRTLEAEHAACDAALGILDRLGDAAPGLDFTRDGMAPFLAEPGNQPALGSVEARCGRGAAAAQRLEALARRGDPASLAFAYQLARQLPQFDAADWTARLNAVAQRAEASAREAAWPTMVWGLLQMELGRPAAEETLKSVVLLPDRNLAHHHSRLARSAEP